MKMLFVEDDEKIREVFTRFLTAKGHQVWSAADGQEAVACVARHEFDLVIMDVKLPKLDGVSAFQEMKKIRPRLRVIFLTGFRMNEELERTIEGGSVECLRKPLLLKDLDRLLDRMAHDASGGPRVTFPQEGREIGS